MKMKRFAAMLLAGTMLTGLCACGSSGGDKKAGSGSSGDELKVSVILKTEASEHWQLIKAGCEQYEKGVRAEYDACDEHGYEHGARDCANDKVFHFEVRLISD